MLLKNYLKRSFTLVELVSVIVVLGILAAIVMVNVGNSKDKATASYLKSNIHELQLVVDRYYMEEENYPTALAPTVDTPREIDLERLRPEYIHSKRLYEKLKEQRYWVDVNGRVWGSVLKLPRKVIQRQDGVEFSSVAGARYYEIIGVKKKSPSGDLRTVRMKTLGFVSQVGDGMIRAKSEAKEQGKYDYLLVSVHDKFGVQTAPTANGGEGFDPLIRKTGKYQFTVIAERDKAELVDFIKDVDVPEGASVDFTFDTIDMQENPIDAGLTIFPKGEKVHGVTVHIEMKASPTGKKPSLYDAMVLFKYDEKVQRVEVVGKEATQDVKDKIPACAAGGCVVFDTENTDDLTDFNFDERPQNLNEESDEQGNPNDDNNDENSNFTGADASSDDRFEVWDDKIICVVGCTYGDPEDYKASVQTDADKKVTDETIVSTPAETKKETTTPPEDKEEEETEDWTTVDDLYLSAGSGIPDAVKWLRTETKENVSDKERTRVKYTYSAADGVQNGRIAWQGAYEDFSELPVSRYARAHIEIQVKTKWVGKVTEPEFISIKFYHEQGDSGVLTDEDVTPMILLNKDNNPNSNVVTPTSNVTWDFDLLGKSKDEVVKTEWKTLQSKFSIGSYENTLRVQFKDGKWSKTTTLPFEVKEERPTVQLTHNIMNQVVYYDEAHSIQWGYIANDPDEDGMKSVKWRGNKKEQYGKEDIGTISVEVQVEDMEGNLSEWTGVTFNVLRKTPESAIGKSSTYITTLYNQSFLSKDGKWMMRGKPNGLSYPINASSWTEIPVSGDIDGLYTSYGSMQNESNYSYVAVLSNGDAYVMGNNYDNKLGIAPIGNKYPMYPYLVKSNISNVKKAGCGIYSCVWLKKDGSVTLSSESTYNSYETNVVLPQGEKIVDVIGIKYVHYLVSESGNVYSWTGKKNYGSSSDPLLGLANKNNVQNPTKIPLPSKVIDYQVDNQSLSVKLENDTFYVMGSDAAFSYDSGPGKIVAPQNESIKKVWGGGELLLTKSGKYFAYGSRSSYNYPDTKDDYRTEIKSLSGATNIYGTVDAITFEMGGKLFTTREVRKTYVELPYLDRK